MVIDGVVTELSGGKQTYDRAGEWAARGVVSEELLRDLMHHPFLRRRPPKTTGREEFGRPLIAELLGKSRKLRLPEQDIVATATAFTAASIADAYKRFVFPKLTTAQLARLQIILGGGGAKNPTLRRMLRERTGIEEIRTVEDFGLANAAKEALAFAILAHETLHGNPGNVPRATGARHPVVLGKIVYAR
jgi:anhydro-N-acetylmuramic acid kinase